MVALRPFIGTRPLNIHAKMVSSLPYDVLNGPEARKLAHNNPLSFFHVSKPEIDLPDNINLYSEEVYQTGKENLHKLLTNKTLIPDDSPSLYIYKQTMGDHIQYGLIGLVSAAEYADQTIKKHELTRKAKEDDRSRHLEVTKCNVGPVFLMYRDQKRIEIILSNFVSNNPILYEFESDDGFKHGLWRISDTQTIDQIVALFAEMNNLYVADGHHRCASATRYYEKMKSSDPSYHPDKSYNYFMAAIFPASSLKVLDYNRLLLTMNNHTKESLLNNLDEHFQVKKIDGQAHPENKMEFGLYIDHEWYLLKSKKGICDPNDPIDCLDCTIMQNKILEPLFGIHDPRKSELIDFVGGIRGYKELEDRVDSGKAKLAFTMYPTSVYEVMDVADAGKIMPPKSTWFEPKLRDGLVINMLREETDEK